MKEHPYKVGDSVKVIKEGSSASVMYFGKVVTIYEIKKHRDLRMLYILTNEKCDGMWLDEISPLTKLEKALL